MRSIIPIILLFVMAPIAGWADVPATRMVHTPPSHIVPGYRTHLTLNLEDPAGIREARCYFRTDATQDYVFMVLEQAEPGKFYGVLPPVEESAKRVEYLFQAINGANEIVSTRPMLMLVKLDDPPPWQADVMIDAFLMLTERLPSAGEPAVGFAKEQAVQVVDSTKRYGSISDIYRGSDPGDTVATDRGLVDVEPEPTPRTKTPRKKVVRNVAIGGAVVGAAAGAAYAIGNSGGGSSKRDNPDPDPGPGPVTPRVDSLDLQIVEELEITRVQRALGAATGPTGSRFRLDVETPFDSYTQTVNIGGSNKASISIDMNDYFFDCSTIELRGYVLDSSGNTLAFRSQSFNVKCD